MDEHIDRRKARTRRMLRDALMALVIERGYDELTVQEIVDRADLARATFYLHYRDKEELMYKSLEEIYNELIQTLRNDLDQAPVESPVLATLAFQHASQNRDLYRVMLSGQGTGQIIRRVRAYLVNTIRQGLTMRMEGNTKNPIPMDIVAHHIAGSLLTLIDWWLENDLPYTPEYMAKLFQQITVQAMIARFQPDLKFWTD